ncbi:hypothetical protein Tco_0375768 [Tanacetum coccineum]
MSLFGQDDDTFTSTMFLNVDQLQKQLDKDEFQENESMVAFWMLNNQLQQFIDSWFSSNYDNQMTSKYFVEYIRIEVKHFRDTLLQHIGNVKKSVTKRTRHKRLYDIRVNKRQTQTKKSKVDAGKALDADLIVTKSSETKSKVQDESSRSRNDTDTDDADIRPIYDEEPMAELSAEQVYWSPVSKPIPPMLIEKPTPPKVFPIKLLTTSMVKDSLQKAKNHLDKFDDCVKARIVVIATN